MTKTNKTPKRGFIRALWGVHDKSHRITQRRYQTDTDIGKLIKSNYNEPFVVYTFGKENHKDLMKVGFNSILVHDDPFKWDLVKYQYRHKLEILKYAFEEDGYDEIVHIDWDCFPTKKLTPNFWELFGQKETVQANLQKYKARKCTWRKGSEDQRYLPNGGFFYIRDKEAPEKLIKIWEGQTKNRQSAEPSMAKLLDDMMGDWTGPESIEKYWELFEPEACNLHKRSPYNKKRLGAKESCFKHFAGGRTRL